MQKVQLKKLRMSFREGVFARDDWKCVFCHDLAVDAHHITDRTEMPNDGYVLENGVSLCGYHHQMAEQFHITGGVWWFKGFHPDDIYIVIGSSHERAVEASRKLDGCI